MNLTTRWLILWIFLSLFFCSALTTGWWFENWKTIKMAEQGYEERTVIGRQAFAWQKVK